MDRSSGPAPPPPTRASAPAPLSQLLYPLFFSSRSPPLLIFHFAVPPLISQSACGLTETRGSDGGCQTVGTYLFTDIHTCMHLTCWNRREAQTGKRQQLKHIILLNFHAFISSKSVSQACRRAGKLLVDSPKRLS